MVSTTTSHAFIAVPADIAVRAYEIYMDRGCVDGFDREDWFQAERELIARQAISPGDSATKSKKR